MRPIEEGGVGCVCVLGIAGAGLGGVGVWEYIWNCGVVVFHEERDWIFTFIQGSEGINKKKKHSLSFQCWLIKFHTSPVLPGLRIPGSIFSES